MKKKKEEKKKAKSAFGMKIEIDAFIENNAKARPHVLMIMITV